MRAVLASRYGGPDILELGERDDPKLGPDSVLVRVEAASINPVDYKVVRGYLDGAFPTVLPLVPGWDVAGEVVATGPAVTHVAPGQAVFGYARKDFIGEGTWAELVSVPARGIAPAPESIDAVQASCLPLAGLTAYQALVETLDVRSGDTVLVHAASGGVGTLATQIAVARGARVIGTASERHHDHVRSLGGEPVTYGDGLVERVRDLAPDGIDAALDLAGGDALAASAALLPDGSSRMCSVVDAKTVLEMGGHYVFVRPDVAGLEALAGLVDKGDLRVVVSERYALDDVADAVRAAESESVPGKRVLTVD